jgi:CDGSH-type Zn-finger protein
MARLVKRTATGPRAFVIDGKQQWLCRCALSANQPYWYDDANRHEAQDHFPRIRTG